MFTFLFWQSFDFRSIRVDSPLLLIVNGKKQNMHSQMATSVSYKPQGEWAEPEAKRKDLFVFLLDLEEFRIIDVKMDALALPQIAQINV